MDRSNLAFDSMSEYPSRSLYKVRLRYSAVTALQTILILVLVPLAIYSLIALLTLWPKSGHGYQVGHRYQPGQKWTYPAVWWTANPAGLGATELSSDDSTHSDQLSDAQQDVQVQTARGGARGNW